MNKVVLVGRLVKDPELKFAQGTGTAVCTFTIAVNRRFKRENQPEADFIPVVVFGKTAEACATYTAKGKLISVSGGIQTRNYEAKDGTKKYVTEIISDEVDFIEWATKPGENKSKSNDVEYTDVEPIEDGEIPFN